MRLGRLVLLSALVASLVLVTSAPGLAVNDHPATPNRGIITIAIIDSGIRDTHVEFDTGQVVAWKDFVGGKADPYDDVGHGTSVASVAAGKVLGEHPGAKLIVAKVCQPGALGGTCNTGFVADAIIWAIGQGADIINLSLGSQVPTGDGTIANRINTAHSFGVLVTVSAGNGVGNLGLIPDPSELSDPSSSHRALVVGASNEAGAAQLGFSLDPELTQAGVSVLAAGHQSDTSVVRVSGTSFSSPNAAGIAAAVLDEWKAVHGVWPDVNDLELFLKRVAVDTSAQPTFEGYGFLDKDVALAAVPGGLPGPYCTGDPAQDAEDRTPGCRNELYVETFSNTVRQLV